uniref:Uncharacterized protein n=1 Tax=Rhizophora mucronata TaxID=61149 RepID=A0A2P2QLJ7_RHIMU
MHLGWKQSKKKMEKLERHLSSFVKKMEYPKIVVGLVLPPIFIVKVILLTFLAHFAHPSGRKPINRTSLLRD